MSKQKISNPGVNYGVNTKPLKIWTGRCLSFERRVRFGKEMPNPWWKEYEVRADNPEMALQLLAKKALNDGYALGGVQDVHEK